ASGNPSRSKSATSRQVGLAPSGTGLPESVNPPLPLPSRTAMLMLPGDPSPAFATTRSALPSPFMSATRTAKGAPPPGWARLGQAPRPRGGGGVGGGGNRSPPLLIRIEMVLSPALATARSVQPSPLKSPAASENGPFPTG